MEPHHKKKNIIIEWFIGLISHYGVKSHKWALRIYAAILFIVCIFIFALILRGLFEIFMHISIFDISQEEGKIDVSYMADFMGGMIGVIVGFALESVIISRLNTIKSYEPLLGILAPELWNVKNTELKKLLYFEGSNFEDLKKFLDKVNKYCELKYLDEYDDRHLLDYELLFDEIVNRSFFKGKDLNNVFYDENKLNELLEKTELTHIVDFRKNQDVAVLHEEDTRFKELQDFIKNCINFDKKRIDMVILDDIVTDSESLAVIHNLPTIVVWLEKKGHIVELLKEVYLHHHAFNELAKGGMRLSEVSEAIEHIMVIDKTITDILNIIDYKELFNEAKKVNKSGQRD